MTKSELYEELNYINATRTARTYMSEKVLKNPSLLEPLLAIVFDVDDPIASRACWVLEFVVKEDLRLLDDYLDTFLEKVPTIHQDSSVRPVAKICEILVLEYYSKKDSHNPSKLTESHLQRISEVCFDWLIGPHKVAAKAYSMGSLYHLGKSFPWIHPELRLILDLNYPRESSGYKARARQILSKIP